MTTLDAHRHEELRRTTERRRRHTQAVRDAPQLHDRVAAALVRAGLRLSHRARHQWAPRSPAGHGNAFTMLSIMVVGLSLNGCSSSAKPRAPSYPPGLSQAASAGPGNAANFARGACTGFGYLRPTDSPYRALTTVDDAREQATGAAGGDRRWQPLARALTTDFNARERVYGIALKPPRKAPRRLTSSGVRELRATSGAVHAICAHPF